MILEGDEVKDEQDDGAGNGVAPDGPVDVGVSYWKGAKANQSLKVLARGSPRSWPLFQGIIASITVAQSTPNSPPMELNQ